MASASVVLTSDTSGSVTVTVPSGTSIGTTTLTLPTTGGTIQTSGSGYTANGVAYASSTSALATGSSLVWTGSALGIGTSSPSFQLQIGATTTNGTTLQAGAVTLSSYSSQGLIAGGAYLTSGGTWYATNTASGQINFLGSGAMTFSTQTGLTVASSFTPTEVARFDSSGNLSVGTTYIGYSRRLAVTSSSDTAMIQTTGGATANPCEFWNTATSGDNRFMFFYTEASPTTRGSITYNRAGGLTVYNTTSDYRAKTVIGPVQNALSKVALLKPSTGRMNDATQDIDFFVAHELQEVVPSAVTGEKDAVNEDSTPNYQMVDKSALIPLLTAAIQEQQTLITSLTERITALENK